MKPVSVIPIETLDVQERARQLADELARMEFRMEEMRAEVSRLTIENDRLHEKYLRENKRVQRLEAQLEDNLHVRQARVDLERERKRFQEEFSRLDTETRYLRDVFPLNALLAAKDGELRSLETVCARLPRNHPERRQIDGIIEHHCQAREQLKIMVQEARSVFEAHTKRIKDSATAQPSGSAFAVAPPPPPLKEP